MVNGKRARFVKSWLLIALGIPDEPEEARNRRAQSRRTGCAETRKTRLTNRPGGRRRVAMAQVGRRVGAPGASPFNSRWIMVRVGRSPGRPHRPGHDHRLRCYYCRKGARENRARARALPSRGRPEVRSQRPRHCPTTSLRRPDDAPTTPRRRPYVAPTTPRRRPDDAPTTPARLNGRYPELLFPLVDGASPPPRARLFLRSAPIGSLTALSSHLPRASTYGATP
jgi:hypothetical protein